MSKTNDGGPAFPRCNTPDIVSGGWTDGMTLRDYFAAAALTGCLASWNTDHPLNIEIAADYAYRQADAMLAEREKGGAK
jgi:hypothetical protein